MTQELKPIEPAFRELQQFDPEKGLKKIAVAEAAMKHARRVVRNNPNDPLAREQLRAAIETKIWTQAEYAIWRDAAISAGQPKKNSSRSERILPDSDPGHTAAHRWRKRLCVRDESEKLLLDEPKINAVIERMQDEFIPKSEMETTVRGTGGTGENEWFTPGEYIKMAREVLGPIDLDPASHPQAQTIVQAGQYFTKDDDGLTREWHGRVWLNPPYAQPLIAQFVSKMCTERKAGRVSAAIMLTHNYTDTAWFHEAAGVADAICFTRGRVKFYEPDGGVAAPTQGQAFFYFGPEVALFAARFNATGFVMVPM